MADDAGRDGRSARTTGRALARTLTTCAAIAAVAACERGAPARGDTTRVSPDSARAALSDPQIVTLVAHLNGAEIGAARAVSPKLATEPARAFARAMQAEHVAMDSALLLLPVRRDTMSQPPPQFATMQAATAAQSAIYMTMPAGPALDRAYVSAQVTSHAQALDSLQHWRTAVRDRAVGTALDDAIARVQSHLQRARALQQSLGGADTTASPPLPLPLTPESAETPATPLGRRKPDTTARGLGRPVPGDTARRP